MKLHELLEGVVPSDEIPLQNFLSSHPSITAKLDLGTYAIGVRKQLTATSAGQFHQMVADYIQQHVDGDIDNVVVLSGDTPTHFLLAFDDPEGNHSEHGYNDLGSFTITTSSEFAEK